MMKRGVSPVIATMLLIALAVILAGIIFAWARGSIDRGIGENSALADSYCEEASFKAGVFEGSGQEETLVFEINNRGNTEIQGVKIRAIKSGEVKVVENNFDEPLGIGESTSFSYPASSFAGISDFEIIPILKISEKKIFLHACDKHGVHVELE